MAHDDSVALDSCARRTFQYASAPESACDAGELRGESMGSAAIGPGDPGRHSRQIRQRLLMRMLATTAAHFDTRFDLNRWCDFKLGADRSP